MKLHYYQDPMGNFGDDLNGLLWPALLGDVFDGRDPLFLGAGTLLNNRLPPSPRKVVFGTGAGYGPPPVIDGGWTIYCVRGPLTAKALGIAPDYACTDAAVLMRLLPRISQPSGHKVFVPHHLSAFRAEVVGLDLASVAAHAGLRYVDPRSPVEQVIGEISGADVVLASAMHAAIVADAFRVPWVPVRLYAHEDRSKWEDWTASLRLRYEPVVAPSRLDAEVLAHFLRSAGRGRAWLSEQGVLDSRVADMERLLDQLRRDLLTGRFDPAGDLLADDQALKSDQVVAYRTNLIRAVAAVEDALPPTAKFLLIDDQAWGGDEFMPGRSTAFPSLDGVYLGPPASGTDLPGLLRAAASAGYEYIVIAPEARWWLDHYDELRDFLDRDTHIESLVGGAAIAELSPGGAAGGEQT